MITPGGMPWYVLVFNEPALLAACIAALFSLVGLIALLGARISGGRPSWRMKSLCIAPLAGLLAAAAAHWIQSYPLANVHEAAEWWITPRDPSLPAAQLSIWNNPAATPQRARSILLVRPVEGGGGIRAPAPTMLPAHDPTAWPERVAGGICKLYPEMTEADAADHAAVIAHWAAFLSAAPLPDRAQVQQRSAQGPYLVTAAAEPFERRRPWSMHWMLSIAIGVAAMILATLAVRHRARHDPNASTVICPAV